MMDSFTLKLGTNPLEDHQVRLGSASNTFLETLLDTSQVTHGRNYLDVGKNSSDMVQEGDGTDAPIGRPAPSTPISSSATSMWKVVDPSTTGRNSGRVCVACKTSKTPLWRGGPQGPKSLCNACGIRYRKGRRALAAAAAVAAATDPGCCFPGNPPFLVLSDQRGSDMKTKKQYYRDSAKHGRRRGRPTKLEVATYTTQLGNLGAIGDRKMLCLTKPSAFPRVLPKDEEDAAMLLMALSGGLVHL